MTQNEIVENASGLLYLYMPVLCISCSRSDFGLANISTLIFVNKYRQYSAQIPQHGKGVI